uniref:Thermostable alkaline protease n=1 Tax=Shouchella clausii TaxID=79880 RepID=I6LHT3_SHOCL|nr:thermostable alkaline protease [Shouchella clausii]
MRQSLKVMVSSTVALLFMANPAAASEEKKEYLIVVEPEEVSAQSVEESYDVDVIHEFEEIPVIHAELTKKELKKLKKDPNVKAIEENAEVTISQTVPWGISFINTQQAHNRGIFGNGARVAVLDTGIASHPDLRIAGGASFISSEPSYHDNNGHGTHVAGTIAALNNSIGVLGVAPSADLYAVKVLDRNGSGSLASVAQGIEWAINNNMHIINMSLGSTSGSSTLELAVNRANNAGILLVGAAGNTGRQGVNYPARYSGVMAAAAVDQNGQRASFSTYGPEIEISAPGVNINSTYTGNRYESLSGTSMATPHVAGVAALVKSRYPSYTNNQIRQRINQTATYLGSPSLYGNGLVHAGRATQ